MSSGATSKKRKPPSSMLSFIVGSSSLSALKLINLLGPNDHFFDAKTLNGSIIFKYPSAALEPESSGDFLGANVSCDDDGVVEESRPVDTGIFLPYDRQDLWRGGHAVYLRKPGFEEALVRHAGLTVTDWENTTQRDVEILRAIDNIPSLDAFLLKQALSKWNTPEIAKIFNISVAEENAIKALLYKVLNPILGKALKSEANSEGVRERMMAAIWNPDLPEARHFIAAFGLQPETSRDVFEAWRGITFYQWQMKRQYPALARTISWLQDKASLPYDLRGSDPRLEQLKMFRSNITAQVKEISKRAKAIFDKYDDCYKAFVDNNDPTKFRNFLEKAQKNFLFLGFSISAISNLNYTCGSAGASLGASVLNFDQVTELLYRMNLCLSKSLQDSESF
jgi:hypothetical protein